MKVLAESALIAAIVVIVSLSFDFPALSPATAKFFAYFGVAVVPTLVVRFATAKSVKEGEVSGFVFECILNVFIVLTFAMMFLGIVFQRV